MVASPPARSAVTQTFPCRSPGGRAAVTWCQLGQAGHGAGDAHGGGRGEHDPVPLPATTCSRRSSRSCRAGRASQHRRLVWFSIQPVDLACVGQRRGFDRHGRSRMDGTGSHRRVRELTGIRQVNLVRRPLVSGGCSARSTTYPTGHGVAVADLFVDRSQTRGSSRCSARRKLIDGASCRTSKRASVRRPLKTSWCDGAGTCRWPPPSSRSAS